MTNIICFFKGHIWQAYFWGYKCVRCSKIEHKPKSGKVIKDYNLMDEVKELIHDIEEKGDVRDTLRYKDIKRHFEIF